MFSLGIIISVLIYNNPVQINIILYCNSILSFFLTQLLSLLPLFCFCLTNYILRYNKAHQHRFIIIVLCICLLNEMVGGKLQKTNAYHLLKLPAATAKSLQSYPTHCDPMDCSPLGFSVHGIFQAIILEWVAISSSKGSFQPRNHTHVSYISCIAGTFFDHMAHHALITCLSGNDQ